MAADGNKAAAARILLDAGADKEALSSNGTTVLAHACSKGSLDVVKLLVEAAVDVNRPRGYDGNVPLSIAAIDGHQNVIQELLRAPGIQVNLCGHANTLYHKDFPPSLLDLPGIVGELRPLFGYPPLAAAAENMNVAGVLLLLKAGADVNQVFVLSEVNDDGEHDRGTPLHAAVLSGCPATVKALIDAGADVNWKKPDGSSVLFHAKAMAETPAATAMLRGMTASLNALTGAQNLPFNSRKKQDYPAVKRILEEHNAVCSFPEL